VIGIKINNLETQHLSGAIDYFPRFFFFVNEQLFFFFSLLTFSKELQAKMKGGVPALKPMQVPPVADVERGAMDNMIAAIRAGAAFRRS
jgi:hypothetical protein